MRKRIWSILAVLCFVAVGLVAFTPATPARATTPAPIQSPVAGATNVAANNNGGYSVMACNNAYLDSFPAAYVSSDGVVRNSVPPTEDNQHLACQASGGYALPDGTLFDSVTASGSNGGGSQLVAYKNGRKLWATDTTSPDNCVTATGWTNEALFAASIAIGSDGNIYATFVPGVAPQACDDRLMGFNRETGAVLFNVEVDNLTQTGAMMPKLWTYGAEIVVVNRDLQLRSYDYTGNEDTTKRYQFPLSIAQVDQGALASINGTVYLSGLPYSGTMTLAYHKADGTSGTIDDTTGYGIAFATVLTTNGGVANVTSTGELHRFNLDTNTVTITNLPINSGGTMLGYIEDSIGNQLIVSRYEDGGQRVTEVATIDAETSVKTVEETLTEDLDDTTTPNYIPAFKLDISQSVGDGLVYLLFCHDAKSNCNFNHGHPAPDVWIHKIPLSGFGTALKNDYTRTDYVSQKLNYVAMGDSFSSGEGNAPFLSGTDVTGVNECHRSQDAYPELLEATISLGLNMTAFTACSGATTDTLMNGSTGGGSWGEGSQLNSLNAHTDIVTLSIGGNDIGFKEFATACVVDVCDEYSPIYASTMASISTVGTKLEAAYTAILQKLPQDSQLYVIDYPMMVPMDMSASNPSPNPLCEYLHAGSRIGDTDQYNVWGNARGAQDVISHLNAQIDDAVYTVSGTDSRIQLVDISGAFEGHDVCSLSSYFFVNQLPPGTFHPNADAHAIIKDAIARQLSQ